MTREQHTQQAPKLVAFAILTISDTRTEDTDTSGRAIADLLVASGHQVAGRTIVKDDPDLVRSTIERQLAAPDVHAIITTGGTGITSRDSTFEAVDALLEKRLDGFGELFRMLSFEQIGPAAMMSRASAGLAAGKIVEIHDGDGWTSRSSASYRYISGSAPARSCEYSGDGTKQRDERNGSRPRAHESLFNAGMDVCGLPPVTCDCTASSAERTSSACW